jgi:hypothetical protein
MTDKNLCFICLHNSNNLICSTCTITAHYSCFNKFLINYDKPPACPQCRLVTLKYRKIETRSTTQKTRYSSLIKILTDMINKIPTDMPREMKVKKIKSYA